MSFKELQARTDEWVGKHKDGYWEPLAQIACLTEEVGELAKEVNQRYGPKNRKPTDDTKDIGMEIADCVVILCCLANSLDIDLDTSWEHVWEKFETRDKDRFPKKLGQ